MRFSSTTPQFAAAPSGRALLRMLALNCAGLLPFGLLLALPAQK